MPPALTAEMLLAERRWIEDLARRLVRDPNSADDAAQETLRRALTNPPARVSSPRGWLHAVLRTSVREMRRSQARREARELAAVRRETAPAAGDLVARADAHRLVLAAVLDLDPPSREVVLLRFFEDLAPAEIALRLGQPAATVRSRLSRALAVLRARLDREYGGDRSAWGIALLGANGPVRAAPSGLTKGAAIMTATTKILLATGAVALAMWLLWDGTPRGAAQANAGSPDPAAPAEAARSAPRPRAAPGAAAASTASSEAPPESTSAAHPGSAAAASQGPVRLVLRTLPPRAAESPPDIPGAGTTDDGGAVAEIGEDAGTVQVVGGGMRLVGWSKWKPVPEKGSARLSGRVVDAHGAPLAGAEILRIEAAAGGGEGDVRDHSHIVAIGASSADGTFDLAAQPARTYRLTANWHHTMSRADGLEFSGLVEVAPGEGASVRDIRLVVPIDARDFGTITGRVIDDVGDPVLVEVNAGFVASMTSADGRFRLAPVPAGERAVEVQTYGFRPAVKPVTVRAGADSDVEIRIERAVKGTHEIEGVVRDEDRRPVAGARVYCGGIDDVYLRSTTGPDGAFRFRDVPAAPAGASYWLAVHGDDTVLLSKPGFTAPSRGVVLEVERSYPLRVVVRDAATGEALPLFNVTTERRGVVYSSQGTIPMETAAVHEEDGVWDTRVPRGETVLFIEAPDHTPVHAAIDVPASGDAYEILVEMRR